MDSLANNEQLVRKLLSGIAIHKISATGIGWNSDIFTVNDEIIVKVPRTMSGRLELEKEIAITSAMRNDIPVMIPDFFAKLPDEKPKAAAYRAIEGIMITSQPLEEGIKFADPAFYLSGSAGDHVARQLADILSSIHGVDLKRIEPLLAPFVKESWSDKITSRIEKCKEISNSAFSGTTRKASIGILDELKEKISRFRYQERFIHGDFGGWNILFDPVKQKITGLLDWGDACIGDPAKDFTELIYDFGYDLTNRVIGDYTFKGDENLFDRAETYLKLAGFQDLEFGLETGSEYFINKGKAAILRLIENQKQ